MLLAFDRDGSRANTFALLVRAFLLVGFLLPIGIFLQGSAIVVVWRLPGGCLDGTLFHAEPIADIGNSTLYPLPSYPHPSARLPQCADSPNGHRGHTICNDLDGWARCILSERLAFVEAGH